MRRVADPDIIDRIAIVVDHDAESADWDAAIAKFLLAYIRQKPISTVESAATEPVDYLSLPQAEG